jgi:hypothetical protein
MSHDVETPQSTQIRPSKPESALPPRRTSMLSLLNLVGLVAALGLSGYALYEQHEQSKADKPVKEEASKAEDKIKPEVAKLEGQVKDLARTVEERPNPSSFAPQIKGLEDRADDLGKSLGSVSDRLDVLGKKVDALGRGDSLESSPKFEAIEKRIAEVAGTLDSLKAQVATMTNPVALAADEMGQATSLFKQGKWSESKALFAKLQAATPDDARVWYFSALANGLASRDWKGESERLVAAGMAREKAGKPDKAKIDAAFADLTIATGKDWLAYYRNLATQAPASR